MNNTSMRAPLTLDSEKARWLGVCAGIARWLDLPIALVRVIFVICIRSSLWQLWSHSYRTRSPCPTMRRWRRQRATRGNKPAQVLLSVLG